MTERGRVLAEAAWPELPQRPLVVVPVGSSEQHGPHLPLQTDSLVATALTGQLADELGGYVAPTVTVEASGEHQGFPGTLSIGTEVLCHVLVELVRSLSVWAGRVLLLNGHGGNVDAMRAAVTQLVDEGHTVQWLPCVVDGDAHAGRVETSLLMHLAPSLVRRDRLEAGNTTALVELFPDLRAHGVQKVSPNGVLGDPRDASAAEGARLFARMLETVRRGL